VKGAWPKLSFDAVIEDRTGGNKKTLQSEFAVAGRFKIVDQGKELIAGYTDDKSKLCQVDLPVIVFGDHTRVFKYVDFPFCLGADGVKVLKPIAGVDVKYVYHYLRQLTFTDAGYSRHFKYLRRALIPLPPLDEQRRIAVRLDGVDELRTKRRAALTQLDLLTEAIFLDMFGAPSNNSWRRVPLESLLERPLRNGVSPSRKGTVRGTVLTLSAVTGHEFAESALKSCIFDRAPNSEHTVDAKDLLICRGNGNLALVGKGYFPSRSLPRRSQRYCWKKQRSRWCASNSCC